MVTIIRTNDIVLISAVQVMLEEDGLHVFVADAHISSLEGGIGAFPRRIMVPEDEAERARRILTEAGLGAELTPEQSGFWA